jgi:hypothetical protein
MMFTAFAPQREQTRLSGMGEAEPGLEGLFGCVCQMHYIDYFRQRTFFDALKPSNIDK